MEEPSTAQQDPSYPFDGIYHDPNGSNSMNDANAATEEGQDEENVDIDTQALMKNVNDQLEVAMADYKLKVKQIFKELVAFQQDYLAVQKIWTPVQQAEHQEADRLDDLAKDLEHTMEKMPWLAAAMQVDDSTVNESSAEVE